jgi:2-polyprenyl-3-methyl-5-hydroxy-6-metoxy-1,4-benzoquinol methylase
MLLQMPFAIRSTRPELMDNPACDDFPLLTTLAHFKVTNQLFARTGTLARSLLLPDMQREAQEYSLIDAGCGGGDDTVRLAALCRDNNISCKVKGIDIDPRSIGFALQRWSAYPEVSFRTASLFDLPTDGTAADYIIAANVLHHFPDADLIHVVSHLCKAARRGVLIADLERSPIWYVGFALFAWAMFRGGFTSRDGLLSIRKGFTKAEFAALGQMLPSSHQVKTGTLFPGRVYLYCRRSEC